MTPFRNGMCAVALVVTTMGWKASEAAPMTLERQAARYAQCWGFFNDRKWDDFKACYADGATSEMVDSGQPMLKGPDAIARDAQDFTKMFPDAKGDIQLTLVGEAGGKSHVVGIVLVTGTNDGPMKGPKGEIAPTHKKLGLLIGHVLDFDAKTGKATSETSFIDQLTMNTQLGVIQAPHRDPVAAWPDKGAVVVQKNDATEKKNLESHHQAMAAWNKHDAAGLAATRTKDAVWIQMSAAKDMTEKEVAPGLQQLWTQFPDIQMKPAGAMAVGDYVVHFGVMAGTGGGKTMNVHYFNVQHYKDGKADKGWIFMNTLALAIQMAQPTPK